MLEACKACTPPALRGLTFQRGPAFIAAPMLYLPAKPEMAECGGLFSLYRSLRSRFQRRWLTSARDQQGLGPGSPPWWDHWRLCCCFCLGKESDPSRQTRPPVQWCSCARGRTPPIRDSYTRRPSGRLTSRTRQLERSEHRTEDDHDGKRDDGPEDTGHGHIHVALAVGRATHRKQRHDRAVVRQAVEGA